MTLAAEDIVIRIDGERIVLRPTLRVALRLERRHEGLAALVSKIQDGNLAAIADVLRENASTWSDVPTFIEVLASKPGIYIGVERLLEPLIAFLYSLAGASLVAADAAEETTSRPQPASRETFAEHLEALFRIGTGWLGWSPAQTWDSTPSEIRAAQAGLIEFQNALRGVVPTKADTRSLDDKWRDLASRWTTRVEAA